MNSLRNWKFLEGGIPIKCQMNCLLPSQTSSWRNRNSWKTCWTTRCFRWITGYIFGATAKKFFGGILENPGKEAEEILRRIPRKIPRWIDNCFRSHWTHRVTFPRGILCGTLGWIHRAVSEEITRNPGKIRKGILKVNSIGIPQRIVELQLNYSMFWMNYWLYF